MEKTPNEKDDFYFDDNGFTVFTEQYHLKRGYCCGNGCRHCPYNFDEMTALEKSNILSSINKKNNT